MNDGMNFFLNGSLNNGSAAAPSSYTSFSVQSTTAAVPTEAELQRRINDLQERIQLLEAANKRLRRQLAERTLGELSEIEEGLR